MPFVRPILGLARPEDVTRDSTTRTLRLRFADVDEVGEGREVFRVPGKEGDLVDVRRRRDDEINGTTARLAATPDQGRREPTPFARDGSVNRERLEGRLDDPEPLRSSCSLVIRRSDQHAEVQLSKRG